MRVEPARRGHQVGFLADGAVESSAWWIRVGGVMAWIARTLVETTIRDP